MDISNLMEIFGEDISKMVRDYIFYLDKKMNGDENLNKEFDYVKIHNIDTSDNHYVSVSYQILHKKSMEVRYFETPVEIKIPYLLLIASIYKTAKNCNR